MQTKMHVEIAVLAFKTVELTGQISLDNGI